MQKEKMRNDEDNFNGFKIKDTCYCQQNIGNILTC